MQIFFHSLLCAIVITLLNGCFFFQGDEQRWEIEPNGATSFALSRDGRFALLYSQQKQLLLWDLAQNQELAQLGPQDQLENQVSRIRISDNGRFAITASQMNFAVWEIGRASCRERC